MNLSNLDKLAHYRNSEGHTVQAGQIVGVNPTDETVSVQHAGRGTTWVGIGCSHRKTWNATIGNYVVVAEGSTEVQFMDPSEFDDYDLYHPPIAIPGAPVVAGQCFSLGWKPYDNRCLVLKALKDFDLGQLFAQHRDNEIARYYGDPTASMPSLDALLLGLIKQLTEQGLVEDVTPTLEVTMGWSSTDPIDKLESWETEVVQHL